MELSICKLDETTKSWLESEVFKGKIVGRREGRGGLIYIVKREGFPQLVTYKTIKEFEESLDRKKVDCERFDREAKNWLSIAGHPLIIEPFSINTFDDIPLICMPYCDGDLSELVSSDMGLTSVVCLSMQIVKGMIAANKRGMDFHQDIKPENILFIKLSNSFPNFPPKGIDPYVDYSVRIADFGVANAYHNKYLGGTNIYKAPEQHDPERFTKFAPDIFAVGLVIAELYQGYHPAVESTDLSDKLRNWKGSKLKKWTLKGDRNLAAGNSLEAQGLIRLIKKMLFTDPNKRPSFEQCYKELKGILQSLCPQTLVILESTLDYFDYVSKYCELEDHLHKLLHLSHLPSQYEEVKKYIGDRLRASLKGDQSSLDSALEKHILLKAYEKIYRKNPADKDRQLLIKGSELIVRFMIDHHNEITSENLWPDFNPDGLRPERLGSDIEAKAEFLYTSIERLEYLKSYDKQLIDLVNSSDEIIEACGVMHFAGIAWRNHDFNMACSLLSNVIDKVPVDDKLISLYDFWRNHRDVIAELGKSPNNNFAPHV